MQRKEITKYQRKVLSLLLNKYERSKTYSGDNKVNQSFSIRPDSVFREYYSDFADPVELRNFHQEMEELEHFPAADGAQLIALTWKNEEIRSIKANVDAMPFYYSLLGSESKDQLRETEKEFYRSRLGRHPVIDSFLSEQLERLESGKKASLDGRSSLDMETAETVLKLAEAILTNEQDLLERELSIMVLSDSKTFEKHFRTRVCRFMMRYDKRWQEEISSSGSSHSRLEGIEDERERQQIRNDRSWSSSARLEEIEDERERQQIILEEYGVFANPSYVYLKGDGDLWFEDSGEELHLGCEHPSAPSSETLHLSCEHPLALSSETLRKLKKIQVYGDKIITVENITSFNRLSGGSDRFYIYLSGYHNTVKQRLLQKIYRDQECEKQWLHFGDIDPDGFYILESLNRGTGIDIRPLWMGIEELKTYAGYGKPLQDNDRIKAKNLLRSGKYEDVMRYMLDNDLKLEQEIISWMRRDPAQSDCMTQNM